MSRVAEVLKFPDKGLSVEDAKKKMIESGEAPRGDVPRVVRDQVSTALEPELEEESAADVVAPASTEPQPTVEQKTVPIEVPVEKVEDKTQRIETSQFVAEVRQEKGQWIAEINYKHGIQPGPERFIASSKNELLLKMLEGKGHATVRVRQAVRREKLGRDLDRNQPLPPSMTAEQFQKLDESTQSSIIKTMDWQQSVEFMNAHPEYHRTADNGRAMVKFLEEHNLPTTVKNLEYALEDLSEDNLLEIKEKIEERVSTLPVTSTVKSDPPPAPVVAAVESSAPVVAQEQPAQTRKRASTGLVPGQSSVPSGSNSSPEDGTNSREPSEAELRKMPLGELKRIATADRVRLARSK